MTLVSWCALPLALALCLVADLLLHGAASDAGRVHELFIEQQTLSAKLETDLTRWAELAERVEG